MHLHEMSKVTWVFGRGGYRKEHSWTWSSLKRWREGERKVICIFNIGICPPNPTLRGEKLEAGQATELTFLTFLCAIGLGLGKVLIWLWVAAVGQ